MPLKFMKNLLLVVACLLVIPAQAQFWKKLSSSSKTPTAAEVTKGLKEALTQGAKKGAGDDGKSGKSKAKEAYKYHAVEKKKKSGYKDKDYVKSKDKLTKESDGKIWYHSQLQSLSICILLTEIRTSFPARLLRG